MKSIIARVQYAGIESSMSRSLIRSIILTNCLSLISSGLGVVILIYIALRIGWVTSSNIIAASIAVVLVIPLLNHAHHYNFSRFKLALVIPLFTLLIIFFRRVPSPHEFDYIRSPAPYCIILANMLVPIMVFSVRERWLMIISLLLNFIIIMGLDPLLFYYSNAYKQDYTFSTYLSHNFLVFISIIFLLLSTQFLKALFEQSETRNETLIKRLNAYTQTLKAANEELARVYQEIELKNDKLISQHNDLTDSQSKLIMAHGEIEDQKKELERTNKKLEQSLDEKTLDLLLSNQQLLSQNEELQQFSYTVSHNLRGPVASILGLLHLYPLSETTEDKTKLLDMLGDSARSLETTILDLSKIVDIRNDKLALAENVNLADELQLVMHGLQTSIKEHHVKVLVNIEVHSIVTVKGYLNSILYNLISNAIQYRNPQRELIINVTAIRSGEFAEIEITDNGLGIDLTRYKPFLFKLYKRFHTHIQGKGLGLYLVKQQVEKLNGSIEVYSTPDVGTTFRIFLPLTVV